MDLNNTSGRIKEMINTNLPANEYEEYCKLINSKLLNLQNCFSSGTQAIIPFLNDITNVINSEIQLPKEMFINNNFLDKIISLFNENNFDLIMTLSKFLSRILFITNGLTEYFPPKFLKFLMKLVLSAPENSDINYLINLMCNISSEVDCKNKSGKYLDEVLNAYGSRQVTIAFMTFIFNMTAQAKTSEKFVHFIFSAIQGGNQEIVRIGLWTLSNYAKSHGYGATNIIVSNLEFLLNLFGSTDVPNLIEPILSIFSYCLKFDSCNPSQFPIDYILKLCKNENQTIQFASLQFIRIASSKDPLLLIQSGVLSLMEITEASYRVNYLIVWVISQILAASEMEVLEQLPLMDMLQFLFSKMEGENVQNLVLRNIWGMKITMDFSEKFSLFSQLLENTGGYEILEDLMYSENESVSDAARLIVKPPELGGLNKTLRDLAKDYSLDDDDINDKSTTTPKIKFVYNPK